jgi:hypothetical protein
MTSRTSFVDTKPRILDLWSRRMHQLKCALTEQRSPSHHFRPRQRLNIFSAFCSSCHFFIVRPHFLLFSGIDSVITSSIPLSAMVFSRSYLRCRVHFPSDGIPCQRALDLGRRVFFTPLLEEGIFINTISHGTQPGIRCWGTQFRGNQTIIVGSSRDVTMKSHSQKAKTLRRPCCYHLFAISSTEKIFI